MTTRDSISLAAHAKINLALHVSAPEPSGTAHAGWHRIVSWIAPIALHDDIVVRRGGQHSIQWGTDAPRPTPIDWPIEKDLGVRALKAIEGHVGRSLDASVAITKRVPVGGGLGGGSSDAAAVLVAANQLFSLGLRARDLRTIGATLGSDVSFFIDDDAADAPRAQHHVPRAAIISDFGTVRERVPSPNGEPLLVIPALGCETRAVYRAFDATAAGSRTLDVNREADRLASLARRCRVLDDLCSAEARTATPNDLFEAACVVQPALRPLVARVEAALLARRPDARVFMTGSGSALVVLGAAADDLRCIAGAAIVATRMLGSGPQHPVQTPSAESC